MPNVVRFALDSARTLYVPGAGLFIEGILDIDANNVAAVAKARFRVQPYRATEIGVVDSAAPPPNLPAAPGDVEVLPDPYPQYLTAAELAALGVGGSALVRRQVAGRSAFPAASRNVANTGGTNTQVQQTQAFVLTEDVDDLAFTYGNFFRDSATDMALNGQSPVTMRLGLFDGTNTYPIFWPNGSRDMKLEPGAVATTTPLFFKGVKGQRLLMVRWMRWDTPPTHFPAGTLIGNTGDQVNEWGTALTDRTTSYGAFYTRTAGNWTVFPPLAITARAKPGPVVAVLGDSIASDGANDYNTDDLDYGWAMGALGDRDIAHINLGTSSLASSHVLSSKTGRAQLFAPLLAAGATHLLYALSTNDWSGGRTAAQLLADLATLKSELVPLGIKLIPCTSLPKTNGNTANPPTGEPNTFAQRALFNEAIRTNNGVGFGYYDLAAAAAEPSDPNRWRTDLKAPTGVTVVSGGSGYGSGALLLLAGGATVYGTTTAGVITSVTLAGAGGWITNPPATVPVIRAKGDLSSGTGATFAYTGVASTPATTDGTHPQAAMTRAIRMDFAPRLAALFTV